MLIGLLADPLGTHKSLAQQTGRESSAIEGLNQPEWSKPAAGDQLCMMACSQEAASLEACSMCVSLFSSVFVTQYLAFSSYRQHRLLVCLVLIG